MVDFPTRKYMDDPNIEWKSGMPNFSVVDKKYLRQRTRKHKAGSLEKIVEDIVKTWEMESSHKTDSKDWKTVDKSCFTISVNGGRKRTLQDNIDKGNYNLFFDDSPLFDANEFTNEEAHTLFKIAFPEGFAWELLELHSGPPVVSFTWRHWGKWEGPYRDQQPTGEEFEMFGSCVARVNEDLKLKSIEVYFDPSPMMAMFLKMPKTGCPVGHGVAKK